MTTAQPSTRPSARVAGVRTAAALTAVLALASATLAALTGGTPQVLGALVGAVLVGAFFVFGALSTALAAAYAPATSLMVALLTYTLQVALLGVVFVAIRRSGLVPETLDDRWIGGVVIVGTLVWIGTLLTAAVRERHPVWDVPLPGGTDVTDRGEVRG